MGLGVGLGVGVGGCGQLKVEHGRNGLGAGSAEGPLPGQDTRLAVETLPKGAACRKCTVHMRGCTPSSVLVPSPSQENVVRRLDAALWLPAQCLAAPESAPAWLRRSNSSGGNRMHTRRTSATSGSVP